MDTCNAMTKRGSLMLICDLPKEPRHREHEDSVRAQKWEEEGGAAPGDRVVHL